MSDNETYDFVTIYKGKNSITYLAKEFEELGEQATPYSIRQNPSDKAPFVKFTLAEAEAMALIKSPETTPQGNGLGAWGLEALKRLSNPQ